MRSATPSTTPAYDNHSEAGSSRVRPTHKADSGDFHRERADSFRLSGAASHQHSQQEGIPSGPGAGSFPQPNCLLETRAGWADGCGVCVPREGALRERESEGISQGLPGHKGIFTGKFFGALFLVVFILVGGFQNPSAWLPYQRL